MKKSSNNQTIHSALALMKQCPACSSQYANESVNIITSGDHGSLVSMMCPGCKLAIVILITAMPFGLVGTGLPTDCLPDEIINFVNAEEVSVDDVLEVHALLEQA